MTSQEDPAAICPESTLESANRRNFIRKAAITTAAVGLGSSALATVGKNAFPESSANSAACATYCTLYVKSRIGIGTCPPSNAVCVKTSSGCNAINAENFSGAGSGIFASGVTGVSGRSCTTGGVGVHGRAGVSCAVAIIAQGGPCQKAPLMEFQNNCKAVLSVFSKAGYLGINTPCPSTPLDVVGSAVSPLIGTMKSGATSGDKSAVVQIVNACSAGWNIGTAGASNSICVPDGSFYIQRSCAKTSIFSINHCGSVGIGTAQPSTCFRLQVCISKCCGASIFGNNSSATGVGVRGIGGAVGLCAVSDDLGVCGQALASGGVGIRGVVCSPCGIPIVAKGVCNQNAPLQKWQKGVTVKSVVNKCGWIGIGTSTPSSPLDVVGCTNVTGVALIQAVAQTKCQIPIVVKGACCNSVVKKSGNLQQWEAKCGQVYAVMSAAGSFGLGGVTNPNHVLCISGKAHASSGFIIGPCCRYCTPRPSPPALTVNGGMAVRTRAVPVAGCKTPNCIQKCDYAVLATGPITLTLPPASSQNGMMLFIKNVSSGTVTIAPSGTDTIESNSSVSLKLKYDSLQLISNGSNEWYVLSGAKCGAFVS